MNQWTERIAQFLPSARVGRIQGETMDVENKDIVLGMLQSISMKEYPASLLDGFGFTIIDEVHHISAEVFSRALFKVVTRYMLGLSATMKRKDGLTRVFKMFLGDVVYKKEREHTEGVMVKAIHYEHNSEEYMKEHLNFRGHVNYSSMIKQLCEFIPRSEFIIQLLQNILTWHDGQQLMVIGHNRSLLMYLFERISQIGFATAGYYLGGMKEADLKMSESKNIIIATYAMAAEGLDIKTLTTLVMVTPKTDVCQAVGRILRRQAAQHLVVDIVDAQPIFKRQWAKRLSFYKKQHYKIYESTKDIYMKDEWEELEGRKKRSKKANMKSNLHIGKCLILDD
jgi:superfamily II DNA or RNA helicase